MKKVVPIVIIEFNSYARTIKYIYDFLDSVIYEKVSFIIVDNGDSDNNYNSIKKEIKNKFESKYELNILENNDKRIKKAIKIIVKIKDIYIVDIVLIKAKENYGFAIGNNIGVSIAEKIYKVDHIIFSNSDIRFNESFNLKKLIEKLKSDSQIALVGPKIIGLDNEAQTPCEEKTIMERWNLLSIVWPLNRIFKIKFLNTSDDVIHINENYIPYRILGAFMLFDFKKFLEINMFDENTFLYAEELIIAEKLKQLDYKTYYCNSQILIHEQGGTTKKVLNNINKIKLRFNSEMYYYSRYKKVNNKIIFITKVLFNFYIFKLNIYHYFQNKFMKKINL
ncbi:putative glycosyltransferase [Clostridium pasteurianum DSM 525 = ATCC 6013]|uniref:Putative glycosyltransferase n=1 Tax=Clostridium pasteurianum DSM 525 = ATCC 6013 TaxID=1262449 RepID=A0A0H3IZ07_CLOPA|nr:glycosyltransferase family 2 protein [Clostridium pasteurianum]AJA46756.1 putative glycosyltransferase [Clostridium pasteurianum DSM 525 = ATCC 6013]AJA50744.1 putative glycosyltransferase [Clostridium pasteurianum DSM 525 = ATCC 6013]AOZ74150.1 hypothetical protein AQ983_03145 [Clostridium pasteurianum DSM 525 = ATCC 6013]AOZ77947.1 hypothetical protein AQ984_03145 [Clostridium pasteurianum]ELP58634.1 family 2 glycosyl transferase [Clostridium pasteurianum DSM 525 = ATCC 6013]